jgi:peptide/nickel transport system substrate-binding protein
MHSVKIVRVALATALAITFPSHAAGDKVLRWASAGGVLTWDPHGSTTETPSLVGFRQVYEGLSIIDADLSLRPALATSWQPIDPTTWRFALREGVTFHDGTPFSAEDVVFSIERARAAGSELTAYTSSIAAVKAVDEDTVEISTSIRTCCCRSTCGRSRSSQGPGQRPMASPSPDPSRKVRRP